MAGGQARAEAHRTAGPSRRIDLVLALLLALAALSLRLPGITWGLPSEGHHFSFHPDEYNVLRVLGAMHPRTLDFNPRYFHNPPVYYFLCGGAYLGARGAGLLPSLDRSSLHTDPQGVAGFYLLGRLLSVTFAVWTVLLVAWLTARDGLAGMTVAACLVALSPAHIILSGYMDVDSLLTLEAAAILLIAARLRRDDSSRTRDILLAGALVGLATATKYNGVLLAAALLPGLVRRQPIRSFGLATLASLLMFFLCNPYALLDQAGFREGLRYVLEERVRGRWSGLGHGWSYPLWHTWPWLVGASGLLLALVGAVRGMRAQNARALPPLLLTLAIYLSCALTGTDYTRYALPALPALAVLAALAFPRKGLSRSPWARGTAIGLAALTLVELAVRSGALLELRRGPDPRELASRWLVSRYPHDQAILVPREPYFHSPPRVFMDYFYRGRSDAWTEKAPWLRVRSADWNPAALADPEVNTVVLSEHELLYPATSSSGTGRFLKALLSPGSPWHEVARFDRPARLGPLPLEARLPAVLSPYSPGAARKLRDRRLPHDLKYLNPAVIVFERQGSHS